MGSGLIYAGIILMWAVYFVPRWLRRHEELSETRSVERFSRAMRILSRKDPVPDQRYVVMPPRPEDDDSTVAVRAWADSVCPAFVVRTGRHAVPYARRRSPSAAPASSPPSW